MKNLFIIDGAAGTGKSDMIAHLQSKGVRSGIAILKKYTTRPKRQEEIERNHLLDLIHISNEEFDKLFSDRSLYYIYGGFKYGIQKEELDKLLTNNTNVFVIIRNYDLASELMGLYPETKTILVYIYADRSKVHNRLIEEGYNVEAIDFRLGRLNTSWEDYLMHSHLYSEVLINNSSKTDYKKSINYLLRKYNSDNPDHLITRSGIQFSLVKGLVGHKNTLQSQIHQYPYEKNVFLMMKFRKNNYRIFKYIEEQLSKFGFNCVRADQPEWNLTGDIYNPIAVLYCCKYGIALFDEPEQNNLFSPNVAYELGMMHYQKKECLILRHSSLPSMPFDLIKDIHKRYEDNLEIEEILANWIVKISKS